MNETPFFCLTGLFLFKIKLENETKTIANQLTLHLMQILILLNSKSFYTKEMMLVVFQKYNFILGTTSNQSTTTNSSEHLVKWQTKFTQLATTTTSVDGSNSVDSTGFDAGAKHQ